MPSFRPALAAALVLSLSRLAVAQEPLDDTEETTEPVEPSEAPVGEVTPTEEPDEDDVPEQPLTPPALDTLGGHLTLAASALWAIPFASLEAGVPQRDTVGSGPGVGVDVGYGVSRSVVVGAWGQLLMLGAGNDCSDCSTRSTAFGAFVRYHLVQGVRFDPWMSAGIGYRMTSIDTGTTTVDYSGIEWLRLQLGGDWYAFDKFGFGPTAELDMGRYMARSPGDLGSSANHWQFVLGARVVFDTPGK